MTAAAYELHHGDVLDVLPTLESESFDAMLTDPPYHLTAGKRGGSGEASVNLNTPAGRSRVTTGFMGQEWDGGDIAFQPETWTEVMRVLKPGAFALVFGGTRTFHRLAVALEDAGFEMRDTLMYLYGSGFPKSHNLTGEWEGYGTALKPAWEPVLLVRKPSPLTFAENALRHGTGALNIDGARVPVLDREGYEANASGDRGHAENRTRGMDFGMTAGSSNEIGRWPANVITDGSEAVTAAFPDAPGQQRSVGPEHGPKASVNVYGDYEPRSDFPPRDDSGSAARFFYTAKPTREERDAGLGHRVARTVNDGRRTPIDNAYQRGETERQNTHPTVKPIALTEYLARLLLPPQRDAPRRILVPFAGSGSEIIGALRAGWDEAVGIEREAEYVEIAEARLAHWARGIQPALGLEAVV